MITDWLDPLPVFVYGTLKRGQRNHDAHCQGLLRALPATTRGRLYALPFGYPALTAGDETVHGELLWFEDPVVALRRLDRLEDARPDGSGEYERVVLEVEADGFHRAWGYRYVEAALAGVSPPPRALPGGVWPAR